MKNIYFLTLLIILSCSNEHERIINIATEDFTKSIAIKSPEIYNVRYVPLETNENCRVDMQEQFLYKNKKFYFFDRNYRKNIVVFADNGKFLYKIDKNGLGPGKYANPISIDVDDNDNIYLWDTAKNKFIRYFNEGRNFEEFKIKEGLEFDDFTILDDRRILLNQPMLKAKIIYDTAIYNREYESLENGIPAREIYNCEGFLQLSDVKLWKSLNSVLFYKRFSADIYRYTGRGIEQIIKLNTNLLPPATFVQESTKDVRIALSDKKYIKDITNIFENRKVITFNLNQNIYRPVTYIIDKQSSKKICFNHFNDKNLFIPNNILGVRGDDFFSILNPKALFVSNRVKQFGKKVQESTLDTKTKKILLSLKQNSNYVVVIFSIKNL